MAEQVRNGNGIPIKVVMWLVTTLIAAVTAFVSVQIQLRDHVKDLDVHMGYAAKVNTFPLRREVEAQYLELKATLTEVRATQKQLQETQQQIRSEQRVIAATVTRIEREVTNGREPAR